MRAFLLALCVGALLFNGSDAVAKQPIGKLVGKQLVTRTKQAMATVAVGVMALGAACGLTGCDRGMNMARDVAAPMPVQFEGEPVEFGVIYEHEFPTSWKGAMLAAQEINAAGGINGRQLVLIPEKIYVRDRADAVEAAVNLIIHDEVLAIIGANYSTISEFIDEVTAQHGVPMITIGSTSATLTRAGKAIFLSAFPDSFQGWVMAKLAKDEFSAKTAAVLYWSEDAYSLGLAESFLDNFNALGGEVVLSRGYSYALEKEDEVFAMELGGIIGDTVAAQPDVIFIPGFSESAIVVTELDKAGAQGAFLGADGWGTQDMLDRGGEAIEGAYFSDHFTPDAAPQFTADYMDQYYGEVPDGLSALGYDAVRVAAFAAQRAGDDLNHMTLRDEIAKTENYEGATNIMRYDDERHPIKSAVIFKVEKVGDRNQRVFYKTVNP